MVLKAEETSLHEDVAAWEKKQKTNEPVMVLRTKYAMTFGTEANNFCSPDA